MADAPSRVERVLNLLALLLDTRRPLSREEIVREISGYPPEVSAHRRAFERDKEMLRGMGVPITVVALPGETSEVGYLVHPEEYYLPDLQLGAEETAALRVAVNAISLGSLSAEGALMKLGELRGEAEAPIASLPLVPSLATLFEAFRCRAAVTFEYRGEERTVEPWGLTSKRGHWYMVGFDHSRGAIRSFRADRVTGEVTVGSPATFDAPEDFRPDDHVEDRPWLFGDGDPVIVDVLVDAGHVEGAVAALGNDATVDTQPDGGAVVHVPVVDRAAFRQVVLDLLEHGEVLAPQDVRDDVVAWIEQVAAHHRKRVPAR